MPPCMCSCRSDRVMTVQQSHAVSLDVMSMSSACMRDGMHACILQACSSWCLCQCMHVDYTVATSLCFCTVRLLLWPGCTSLIRHAIQADRQLDQQEIAQQLASVVWKRSPLSSSRKTFSPSSPLRDSLSRYVCKHSCAVGFCLLGRCSTAIALASLYVCCTKGWCKASLRQGVCTFALTS